MSLSDLVDFSTMEIFHDADYDSEVGKYSTEPVRAESPENCFTQCKIACQIKITN